MIRKSCRNVWLREANEAKLVKLKEENSKSKAKAKEDKKEPKC